MSAVLTPLPTGHYRFIGLVRSEWTKLRTVRSTKWTLGLVIVLGVGLSALVTAETAAHWATMSTGSRSGFDPTQSSLIGVALGQFVIGVLGVLAMSAEYGTGTIRATLAASPKRPWVLLSKIAVFGTVAFVASEVVSFVAYFLGQALLRSKAPYTTISDPGVLRAVFGAGLYLTLLGLLALGLATIIRHTAGAISTFVGILLVLPLIFSALPESIRHDGNRFLPANIGNAVTSVVQQNNNSFSPWVGLVILAGYAVALLTIGGTLLVRRDA